MTGRIAFAFGIAGLAAIWSEGYPSWLGIFAGLAIGIGAGAGWSTDD